MKQTRIDNKFIGYTVKGEYGLIFTMPKKKRHKFRMFDSWGIPENLLNELAEKKYWKIRIMIDGGERILMTSPEKWKQKGFKHRTKGYEPQIQLREKDFDMVIE